MSSMKPNKNTNKLPVFSSQSIHVEPRDAESCYTTQILCNSDAQNTKQTAPLIQISYTSMALSLHLKHRPHNPQHTHTHVYVCILTSGSSFIWSAQGVFVVTL